MVKRKVPLLDSYQFLRIEEPKKSLGKSGRFRTSGSLGVLFRPGAPDAGVAPFRKRVCELETIMNPQKPYLYNADRTLRSHVQSMSTPKLLQFLADMKIHLK